MPTWLRGSLAYAGRLLETGAGLARAGLSDPRLLGMAARHVLNMKARFVRGMLRAGRVGPVPPIPQADHPARADLLALLGERMGVLVLDDAAPRSAIGVRDIDLLSAVTVLQAACPDGRLLADDVPADPSGAGRMRIQAASRIGFLLPDETGIDLECYGRRAPGFWLSQNRANPEARALYTDILDWPGLHSLSEILPARSLRRRLQAEPVDVVYTWVNHRDAEWAAAFRQHRPSEGATGRDAAALSRFHSVDELRYSLRSVARNLPWAARIHVLTNCAPPNWLDAGHDRIHWVRHDSIIPAAFLPTFSSHVIESYLHHIPGLANRFLYMNDDFFIAARKEKDFFFGEGGGSRAFLEEDGVVSGPPRPGDPDHLNAARNSAGLLLRDFGFWPTRLHKHAAYALRRDILAEIEDRWATDFDRFRSSRFRDIQDLNLPSFLYHHYALATGRAEVAPLRLSLVMSMDLRWRNRLKNALKDEVDALCINEGGSDAPASAWHSSVQTFLRDCFPRKAPWERDRVALLREKD